MPKNFKGKPYDLRPYVDATGWIVIRRGPDQIKFKDVGGKLCWRKMCDHHIDRFAIYKMTVQFHTIKDILLKEAGYAKSSEIRGQGKESKNQ